MEASLLTPRCTLVPSHFFAPERARDLLGEVVTLSGGEDIRYLEVPQYDAVLIYAADSGTDSGESAAVPPELFFVLRDLPSCREYNKILASWREGWLYLGIAQGGSLLLCNAYEAPDFTTAEYYLFLAMKSLQLNPEVSTVCWRSPVGPDEEMSLYRYFKSVEQL